MKKTSKKSKARNSNNANTVLNEVGGAVKWIDNGRGTLNSGLYCISEGLIEGTFTLWLNTKHIATFKKQTSAKKVAQLMVNG